MKITLNNREENFDCDTMSVKEMLEMKKYSFRLRIIKINKVLIRNDEYEKTIIREGDDVQMIYLMSGG